MHREIVRIRGRVQGVGFRHRVRQIARRFPVHGTVGNRLDGSVEIDVEGELADIEAFLAAIRENPPEHGRIEGLTREQAPPRGVTGFSTAPTA